VSITVEFSMKACWISYTKSAFRVLLKAVIT
jgi:hypothetical protein